MNVQHALVAFEFLAIDYIASPYRMATRLSIAAIIWLFWAFMVARWTDAYYYRMARREIADAIDDYPHDETAQRAHLKREGGVSLFGLGLGFGLFAFALMVIKVQFLPILAKPKENEILFDAYDITKTTQNRIAIIYQQTGYCPTHLPLDIDNPQINISIDTQMAGIANADCVITGRIQNVKFPIRYLNGQTLVFYHLPEIDSWKCTSSLNEKQAPTYCIAN